MKGIYKMKLNDKTTMGCRFIEGAKFDLTDFKSNFDNLEHAIWQANAIALSIIPGPHPVFVQKLGDNKFKVSLTDSQFAVYVVI